MAGRPVEYTQEIADKAWAYVDDFEDHGHAVPSVVGLCKVLNRSRSTLYNWAKDPDKELMDILETINENQELVTFNKALRGEYNATIAKLLLGKHGYSDKSDSTISGGDNPLVITRIERVIVNPTDSHRLKNIKAFHGNEINNG